MPGSSLVSFKQDQDIKAPISVMNALSSISITQFADSQDTFMEMRHIFDTLVQESQTRDTRKYKTVNRRLAHAKSLLHTKWRLLCKFFKALKDSSGRKD